MRAGRGPPSPGGQGSVVGNFGPNTAAHRPEQPHEVTAACRKLQQLVGIGRIGHHHLVAVDAERECAERLQAFECFGGGRAGPHAALALGARDVPRAQLPRRLHRGAVHRNQIAPAVVQLQRGTRQRRVGHRLGLLHFGQLLPDEAVPVQRQDQRRVRAGHGRKRDTDERQTARANLFLYALK